VQMEETKPLISGLYESVKMPTFISRLRPQ